MSTFIITTSKAFRVFKMKVDVMKDCFIFRVKIKINKDYKVIVKIK